jgi:hypothetical protein
MSYNSITSFAVICVCLAILLTSVKVQAQQKPVLDRAYRITGVYENGRVVSLEVTPLEVRLPLTVKEREIGEAAPAEGYFLEMLDSEAKSLLRYQIEDPSFVLMEYEDPEQPGRIVSKEIHAEKVQFSILVPAPVGGHMLRFMKAAPDQEMVMAEKRLHTNLGTFILPATGSGPAVPAENGGPQ